MDMSSQPTASKPIGANDDMDSWKPYLHTILFSPSSFSNSPEMGEPFLFPSFRIYSRSTFLLACLFAFGLALFERYLSFLLDSSLSLRPSSSCTSARRKDSNATAGEASVYVTIPSNAAVNSGRRREARKGKLVGRTVVYFVATLLRYVLMIIGMGMDWFLLLSLVLGLSVGHLGTDLYKLSTISNGIRVERGVEEVELLPHPETEEEGKADGEERGEGRECLHRRSTSTHRHGVTPY